jgi:hypothetical protein
LARDLFQLDATQVHAHAGGGDQYRSLTMIGEAKGPAQASHFMGVRDGCCCSRQEEVWLNLPDF